MAKGLKYLLPMLLLIVGCSIHRTQGVGSGDSKYRYEQERIRYEQERMADSLKIVETREQQKRRNEAKDRRRIDREISKENRLKETPTDNTFTIEFPNLTKDEINNKSYLWLKTKFPNYDEIQEKKGKKIIRIEGKNLLLATPEKMGYRVIIIIDTENKSVKFWIGKHSAKIQDLRGIFKPTSSGLKDKAYQKPKLSKSANEPSLSANKTSYDTNAEEAMDEEQAMDIFQSYKKYFEGTIEPSNPLPE